MSLCPSTQFLTDVAFSWRLFTNAWRVTTHSLHCSFQPCAPQTTETIRTPLRSLDGKMFQAGNDAVQSTSAGNAVISTLLLLLPNWPCPVRLFSQQGPRINPLALG